MPDPILSRAWELSQSGRLFVLATVVRARAPTSARPGSKAIITGDGQMTGWVGGHCAQPRVRAEALRALDDGQPRLMRFVPNRQEEAWEDGVLVVPFTCASAGELEVYVEPIVPNPTLVIIGSSPVAEGLARLAEGVGFEVRQTADALSAALDQAGGADPLAGLSESDFVVVASHSAEDEAAVARALAAYVRYVGLVASPRRAATIREELAARGLTQEQLARLKSPAGLDLGAATPGEIAVSILAEIVQRRRAEGAPASASPPRETAIDPICGMSVDVATAEWTWEYQGRTYYFCASRCRHRFAGAPQEYLDQPA